MSWGPWVRFSRWVVMTPLVWLVVAVNLGSAVAGYIHWYGSSISAAPWYYWLFVPDSPLAVTFVSAAFLVYHCGRRSDLLGLLASGACIKYGLWTVFIWFTDYLWGGVYDFEAVTMSLTHLIMVVEGLILLPFVRFRPIPLVVASLFLIVNDLVDYVSSYHPRVPHPEQMGVVARFSAATTAAVLAVWIVLAWWAARRSNGRGSAAEAEGAS